MQREGFVLNDGNRPAVDEIVRLLDGLPLAIELAAARMRVLSPTQLVQRMGDRFTLLAGVRGPTARQATLEAAIDWPVIFALDSQVILRGHTPFRVVRVLIIFAVP